MVKKYEKPELKIYGDIKDITKSKVKGLDGSDNQSSAS